jgi:hypothetical protein
MSEWKLILLQELKATVTEAPVPKTMILQPRARFVQSNELAKEKSPNEAENEQRSKKKRIERSGARSRHLCRVVLSHGLIKVASRDEADYSGGNPTEW